MGGNIRHLTARYGMSGKDIDKQWFDTCNRQEDVQRVYSQIRELCHMRDMRSGILSREECNIIISNLCTE